MNPLPIALLLLASQGQGGGNTRGMRGAGGFGSFGGAGSSGGARGSRGLLGSLGAAGALDVEPVLDGLHRTVNALERINRMNRIAQLPLTRERAPELLEAIGAPPELRTLVQAGSALMARSAQGGQSAAGALPGYGSAWQGGAGGFGQGAQGSGGFSTGDFGFGAPAGQGTHALPQPGQPEGAAPPYGYPPQSPEGYGGYDDRDPYVTGADTGGAYSAPPAESRRTGSYGDFPSAVPFGTPPSAASPNGSVPAPDFAQLMQTFGPMLKTFMQNYSG